MAIVHIDDAVAATVAALTAEPGVYNIVDDDPLWALRAEAQQPANLPTILGSATPATQGQGVAAFGQRQNRLPGAAKSDPGRGVAVRLSFYFFE